MMSPLSITKFTVFLNIKPAMEWAIVTLLFVYDLCHGVMKLCMLSLAV